jgi:hypothetical protein
MTRSPRDRKSVIRSDYALPQKRRAGGEYVLASQEVDFCPLSSPSTHFWSAKCRASAMSCRWYPISTRRSMVSCWVSVPLLNHCSGSRGEGVTSTSYPVAVLVSLIDTLIPILPYESQCRTAPRVAPNAGSVGRHPYLIDLSDAPRRNAVGF